jgi:hypothetical protein
LLVLPGIRYTMPFFKALSLRGTLVGCGPFRAGHIAKLEVKAVRAVDALKPRSLISNTAMKHPSTQISPSQKLVVAFVFEPLIVQILRLLSEQNRTASYLRTICVFQFTSKWSPQCFWKHINMPVNWIRTPLATRQFVGCHYLRLPRQL